MTRPRRAYGSSPPGRLPAAMVRALAAELSDPGRFARAKEYARDGAVVDIEIEPGAVRGHVQGSRYEPYVAVVHVAPADDASSLLGLIPDRDELMAECTCPDDAWRGFCKHAVATLLVLADEATVAPDALATWRSGEPVDVPEGHVADDTPPVDVLATLLAAPSPLPDLPAVPPRLPVTMAAGRHSDDVAAVLADALSVLRSR